MYSFTERTIKLDEDTDINVELPNGAKLLLQYRGMNETFDICLYEPQVITNWTDHMQPAPIAEGGAGEHERIATQLVICFGKEEDIQTT